ncbi:MAG: signal recognition particle subunit SRP19/SEC65 family protein [Candidatus Heimdallarchaeota archaeon]
MRNKENWMIFPELFDARLSRKYGRRIGLSEAIEEPSLLEIKLAAQMLGYDVETHKDKAYPRRWWDARGLATIPVKEDLTKQQLLLQINDTIRKKVRPALEKRKEQLKTKKTRKKGSDGKGKLIRPIDDDKSGRKKKTVRRR